MNKLQYVLVALAIFSLLLGLTVSQTMIEVKNENVLPPELQATETDRLYEGFTYTIGSPYETEKTCTYLIGQTGIYTYMLNGTNGRMVYYSTNVTLVEQFALGNMTVGQVYLKQIAHNTSLTLTATQNIFEQYNGVFKYWNSSGSYTFGMGGIGAAGPAGTVYGLPYSYIVFTNATATYMVNSVTSTITYYSTNASAVLNNAGGNTTNGIVFSKVGNYSLDTRILLKTGVSWWGEGLGTIFRLMDGATATPEKSNVFWDSETVADNYEIAYLEIDGNAAHNPTLSATANCGCGIYIGRSAANVHIHHVWVHDCDWDGVLVRAYAGYTTKDVWVTDSTVNASGLNDITFWRYNSATASLYDCGAMRNYVGEGTGDYGLDCYVDTGSVLYNTEYVTFSDNIIGNMTGTTGSITSPYGWTGIRLEDASNCIVTGNIIRGVRCGIADDFDSHGRNIITNNQILLKDPSVTYAVNGLYITSDNNTIMGNTVVVPSTVVNGTVGIFLYDASYNTISGNKFIDEGSSGQSVGMQEETAGCTHNLYMGNDVSSCDLPIALAGSSFSLIGNIGLATGLDPAASVISITSSGESLSVGNLVFLNSTGYFKTNAVSSAKMPAIAMATWSGSGGNVLLLQGYFTNASWSWTPGALLYASNSTAGGLTMTYPSNSGAQVEVVGYAVSATKIYFDPCLIIITIT